MRPQPTMMIFISTSHDNNPARTDEPGSQDQMCRQDQRHSVAKIPVFCLVPEQMHAFGKGTASGELQDLLGLGSIDKNVIMTLSTEAEANRILSLFREELYLGMPGSGVAFTIPINAASAGLLRLVEGFGKKADEKEEESMKSEYSMILAFVNQGYSEEVMAAARAAGAGGGTVFHSRRVAGDEALHFWGIQIQEEREIVLIISRKENKTAIMNAISEKCGVRS